jgi:protein CpxP
MISVRKKMVIAMAALFMASSSLVVQAHEGAHERGQQRSAQHESGKGKWAERAAARQARLHDALKLSAAQEPAWAAYQATLKREPRAGQGLRGDIKGKSMPAPERMERAIERAKQRTAAMEARLPALNALYAALSPEQQKVFDEQGHGRRHGGRHQRGRH